VRMRCTPARDATVRFGPVRRPFFPNLEPEPGPVRPEGPNPEPLWGPVRFRSGSGLLAIWTWTEPRTANLALFPYVIKPNWHFKPVVYRKMRQSTLFCDRNNEITIIFSILQVQS
jgi:hypothetical protein